MSTEFWSFSTHPEAVARVGAGGGTNPWERTRRWARSSCPWQVMVKSPVEPRDLCREAIMAATPAVAAVELGILISATIVS